MADLICQRDKAHAFFKFLNWIKWIGLDGQFLQKLLGRLLHGQLARGLFRLQPNSNLVHGIRSTLVLSHPVKVMLEKGLLVLSCCVEATHAEALITTLRTLRAGRRVNCNPLSILGSWT